MKNGCVSSYRSIPSFLPLPFHSFPIMSVVDIPFLAAMLLKLNAGGAGSLSASDVDALTSAIMNPVDTEAPVKVPEPAVPTVPAAPEPVHQAPKIKKIKTEPPVVVAPPAAPPAAPATVPETVQTISIKHCLARMVQQKKVIPGTEANKVYEAKQCIRLRAKGELLCPKCEEYYKAYREKSKGKNNWEGFLNETPLEHLRVVGSKWFQENYPHGLPGTNTTAITDSADSTTTETITETANTANPATETILVPNTTIKEVQWANVKIDGIHYIYNLRDRRIYKADVSKEGEDQILWDSFEGKYIHGAINYYEEENEDVPDNF